LKNTFWDLETDRATAQRTAEGAWHVTLNVRARKVVVDETGIEIEAPQPGDHSNGSRQATGAGIDPHNLLADRDPENNIKNVR
jgi:hypothetical protein